MRTPKGMERFQTLSKEEFARRCRAARAYADLKLEELSDLTGVSRQALSRRERGWVAIATADRMVMVMVLCEASGWPESAFTEEDWLVNQSVEPEPEA